jgi:hypothetical protein
MELESKIRHLKEEQQEDRVKWHEKVKVQSKILSIFTFSMQNSKMARIDHVL